MFLFMQVHLTFVHGLNLFQHTRCTCDYSNSTPSYCIINLLIKEDRHLPDHSELRKISNW